MEASSINIYFGDIQESASLHAPLETRPDRNVKDLVQYPTGFITGFSSLYFCR